MASLNMPLPLQPAQINPNPRPQRQLTQNEVMIHRLMSLLNPVLGRAQHALNDPTTGILLGGPTAVVSSPLKNALKSFKSSTQGAKSVFKPSVINSAREAVSNKRLDKFSLDDDINFISQLQRFGETDSGIKNFGDTVFARKGPSSLFGDFLTNKQKKELAAAMLEAQIRKAAEAGKDVQFIDGFRGFLNRTK